MNRPIIDALELARMEERRQAVATAEVSLESEPMGGGMMSWAGPGAWANQACGAGLDGPVGAEDLDRLVGFYAKRNADAKIEVTTLADMTLVDGLRERGFAPMEFEHVFARRIEPHTVAESFMPGGRMPEGVRLDRVDPRDDAGVERAVRVAMSGFIPPGESITPSDLETGMRVVRHPRSDTFLAWVGDEAVASAGMETSGGIACLFGTSVLPAFRRQGIQQALMATRLANAAQKMGESGHAGGWAFIHARPGIATERNARRMGFSLAYAKANLVLKLPERRNADADARGR